MLAGLVVILIVNPFEPLVSLYTPWKHQKTEGNLGINFGREGDIIVIFTDIHKY